MAEPGPKEAARLIAAAGGEIIGRTRLQKVGCIVEMAGAGFGFKFAYHLYGPYSEQLTIAASDADALNFIRAEERSAPWGGRYFVYSSQENLDGLPPSILALANAAAKSGSIELELAVTAAFLAKNGSKNAWEEVVSRKKAKATPERILSAKEVYETFAIQGLPMALPNLLA